MKLIGEMTFDDGVLLIDNEIAREVIEYLRALVPWSPPQIRSINWTRNARIFGSGKAAGNDLQSCMDDIQPAVRPLAKGTRVTQCGHVTRNR